MLVYACCAHVANRRSMAIIQDQHILLEAQMQIRLLGHAGLFEQAIGLDKNWEKGYFRYAVYLDQLMRDARQRQSASTATKTSSKPVDRLGGRSRC